MPIHVALVVTFVLTAGPSLAQPASGAPGFDSETTPEGFPVARAVRVVQLPEIDGDVLQDPAWADVPVSRGFTQTTPDEGRAASEQTEVRIIYGEDAIYFGVVCFVRDPETIIVADSRRDSSLDETDSFQIIIDTYLDKQNGFVFGTNPAGVEYDGQVTNEGQGSGRFGGGGGQRSGSRQQRGSGGGFNLNWDGVWQVRTQTSDVGWSIEIAIPYRTLRYPSGEEQIWGINFQRNIRNRNETAFWAPLQRQFNLYRLSLAGELQGIQVPAQRNLKLTPYTLGEAIRLASDSKTTTLGDFGGDLKYSVTPSMTLDLTYNTDFAQVEVDDQQINLDRFNLFFPEKRPFFLENAGLFSVGLPGQLEVFFSRRIGIGDNGEQIPLIGGGRISGNIGGNTNVGFLNMQTESVSAEGTPSNNFTVALLRQDFANRSNVGVMFVNRGGTGSYASDNDYNRSYAVDGRLGIGQAGTISGFAAQTDTPGITGETHAYSVSGNYESERYQFRTGYTEVGPNFNPEVGFYSRRGYERVDGLVRATYRPENALGILELTPHVTHFTTWNFQTGQVETQYTHIDNGIEWRNGYRLSTGVNLTTEGVLEPFEIFPGVIVPVETYEHAEGQARINTNRGAPVSVGVFAIVGGFFGGDRRQVGPEFSLRAGEAFNTQVVWSYNDIDLPGGAFTTNLGSLRVNYSFTTRMFVQMLVQYNDRADLWSSNIRFALLNDANTGLFVVYNDTHGLDTGLRDPMEVAGRTLTIKYSHLFDLLN